ncbi:MULTISPECIES: hypothetical protein [Streptosporangium]|uniref:Transcription factor zinc-finger domain-containing protein n=1 Tax=Streptosporangium brasiliense TaxID=47480 RepID=A0ABT9RHI8_9ACTN|nr:hypothetical protein [Streptosporangium brasiliense]MDP9868749.1 hypothetical protein [Streptosporangium brasiliense]
MTDPITCPECEGSKGQRLGRLFLACRFCGGLGWVGGHNEPAERGEAEPPERPAAWEHRIWSDPAVAAALGCRYCLDSGTVAHLDEAARTLVTAPCRCRL